MLVSQAKNSDIMLIPAFDTKKIDDFHTRVAFLRGIENGYSTVRQSNEGSSISADYLGNTLTYQNYYRTEDRVMISDVPVRGKTTLYGLTGEIFLWLDFAAFVVLIVYYLILRKRTKMKTSSDLLTDSAERSDRAALIASIPFNHFFQYLQLSLLCHHIRKYYYASFLFLFNLQAKSCLNSELIISLYASDFDRNEVIT